MALHGSKKVLTVNLLIRYIEKVSTFLGHNFSFPLFSFFSPSYFCCLLVHPTTGDIFSTSKKDFAPKWICRIIRFERPFDFQTPEDQMQPTTPNTQQVQYLDLDCTVYII